MLCALPKAYNASISRDCLPLTAMESRREEKDHGGSRLHHLTYNLSSTLLDTLYIFSGLLRTRSRRSKFWGLVKRQVRRRTVYRTECAPSMGFLLLAKISELEIEADEPMTLIGMGTSAL
jgi:hypothetical protein